LPEATKHFYEL